MRLQPPPGAVWVHEPVALRTLVEGAAVTSDDVALATELATRTVREPLWCPSGGSVHGVTDIACRWLRSGGARTAQGKRQSEWNRELMPLIAEDDAPVAAAAAAVAEDLDPAPRPTDRDLTLDLTCSSGTVRAHLDVAALLTFAAAAPSSGLARTYIDLLRVVLPLRISSTAVQIDGTPALPRTATLAIPLAPLSDRDHVR